LRKKWKENFLQSSFLPLDASVSSLWSGF